MNYITYANKIIPIFGEYDTVVVGGGTSGSSAAISASNLGNKVLIVEKSIFFGRSKCKCISKSNYGIFCSS